VSHHSAEQKFARRLFAAACPAPADANDVIEVANTVFASYCTALAPLITTLGAQAFLTRAVRRAAKDYPFLASLQTRSRGVSPLDGLSQAADGVDTLVVQDACISVLANMAGLLAEFIGDELTMHMLQEIWPEAAERGGE
jgi:hypothetical protein